MKKLDYSEVEKRIVFFLKEEAKKAKMEGYVIGISGGVDSAVVSTLAAKTGLKLYTIQMPIHQKSDEVIRATNHIKWLIKNYSNVFAIDCELTSTFDSFLSVVEKNDDPEKQHMAEANTRSRLRMTALYYHASIKRCLVLGTGNKIEDFGVGFFTKYGDGGVDVSPIGDLMKSEVRELGMYMGVSEEIINAIPTDGLWDNGATDEEQLKASYDELEFSMNFISSHGGEHLLSCDDNQIESFMKTQFSPREIEVVKIYKQRHNSNLHKIKPIPICDLSELRK